MYYQSFTMNLAVPVNSKHSFLLKPEAMTNVQQSKTAKTATRKK